MQKKQRISSTEAGVLSTSAEDITVTTSADGQTIAKDGIAVIVQAGSPIKNLTSEQLADIFGRAVSVWE